MTPKKSTYKKMRKEMQHLPSASRPLPPWGYRALLLSDRLPPSVGPSSGPPLTLRDLPESTQRRINRKLQEVARLMRQGYGLPRRRRR